MAKVSNAHDVFDLANSGPPLQFGELLAAMQPRLMQVAENCIPPAYRAQLTADDLFQEAMVVGLRNRASLDRRPAPEVFAWFANTIRRCKDAEVKKLNAAKRAAWKTISLEQCPEIKWAVELRRSEPEKIAEQTEMHRNLFQLSAELSLVDLAIVCWRWEGFSVAAIATRFEMDKSTVHKHYNHSVEFLHKKACSRGLAEV